MIQFAYALSLIRVGDGMYRRGWRWIFIIEGVVTIVAGLIAPFFLIECKSARSLKVIKD
jgi:MFS family permease